MKFTKTIFAFLFFAVLAINGCAPKDSEVQTNAQEKIQAVPDASAVSVSVADGVATLSGEVKDAATKDQAGEAAKGAKGVKSVVNNLTIAPPPAPVAVDNDASLIQGVTDATKDFPTVAASVANGEITLMGSIERSKLQTLMQSLNSLNPKKINNQLTIK
ncbi:MAG: BON domain-containing protein [Ginsengibacter sp.]